MKKNFIHEAALGSEGEGVEVKRLFPIKGMMNFDPFVLWDNFTVPPSAGFPDHPHRGFEGVTYVLKGTMQHKDNLGNESSVAAGGLQRFTAGSGIVHSEMPSPQGSTIGIQLWVNLPGSLKNSEPDYQQVDSSAIPEVSLKHGSARILVGEGSPLLLKTAVSYQDISLEAGGEFRETMPADFRGLVYVVDGSVTINDETVTQGQAMFYYENATVVALADKPCRFMLCFGRPHGEPIHQHGPYVD